SRAKEEPPIGLEIPARSVCYMKLSTGGSTLRRISAVRCGIGGGILPIGIDETLPVESQPGHLLTQRTARNVEQLHHGADLSAALCERPLNQSALESLDLFGEGVAGFLDDRPRRQ